MAPQQPRRHKLPSEICVSRQLEPIFTFTATFLNNYLRSSSLASARQRRSSLLKFLKLKQFSPLRRKSSGLEVERAWAQAQRPGLAVNKPQAQGSASLISGKAQIRLKPGIQNFPSTKLGLKAGSRTISIGSGLFRLEEGSRTISKGSGLFGLNIQRLEFSSNPKKQARYTSNVRPASLLLNHQFLPNLQLFFFFQELFETRSAQFFKSRKFSFLMNILKLFFHSALVRTFQSVFFFLSCLFCIDVFISLVMQMRRLFSPKQSATYRTFQQQM